MKTKTKNIFKSALSLTLALIMVLGVAPLSELAGADWAGLFAPKAEAATSGIYTYEIANGEATITDCDTSASGDITIPSTLGGYPVTSIGNYAFRCCYSLTSVTIPDSVTSIGDSPFLDCMYLTSITVESKNKDYLSQDGVLFNKDRTELIQYPIGNLRTSYTIPNGVKNINDAAFRYGINLISIIIPEDVITIGQGAFQCCVNLMSIIIPDSVTSIGGCAFYGCSSLTSVTIPNSVTSIGEYAFYACGLTSVTIPDSVTSIGECAFCACGLTSVTIRNGVTEIGYGAFAYCDSLTSVTIPNSVTSIGAYAFAYCDSLTSVTIPNSVTSIGDYAFYGCSGLEDIDYTGTEEEWKSISIGNYNEPLLNATIHYNSSSTKRFPNGYDFYEDSYNFENYSDTISKKYFTTIYGSEKGKLLYKTEKNQGGLCFGFAYTTAAIYNGYPSCSKISTLDKGLFKYKYCEKIRDIWNLSVDFLDFTSHTTKIISSALPIGNNVITIEDYIKYAYIYQYSKTVTDTSVWCSDANVILNLVKQYTDKNTLGVTIGMIQKDGNGGHRVLAVGYEGNDILVDDPNEKSKLNRITVNPDGSWSFNGLSDWNSTTCEIRYNLDYQKPFELLLTGKTETVNEKFIESVATQETYIEGIDILDKESKLLVVDSESYDLNNKEVSAVYAEGGDVNSADIYWTDDATVLVDNVSGGNRTVEFAGDGTIISAEIADSSNVAMTIDGEQLKAQISGKKGDACTLSIDTCYKNDSNDDVSRKIEITGTVSESEVVAEQTDKGIRVSGIENGTVSLVVDDNVVSTEKIPDEGESFDVIYSKQEGDNGLSVQKVETPKKDSIFKKILNVLLTIITAPFRLIIGLFKLIIGLFK